MKHLRIFGLGVLTIVVTAGPLTGIAYLCATYPIVGFIVLGAAAIGLVYMFGLVATEW
jgi:hypothetical protein